MESWEEKIADKFEIIRQHDWIDEEELRYKVKVIPGLSAKEFADTVWTVTNNLEPKTDSECPFDNRYVDYKGIRLKIMNGQGIAFMTEKLHD